MAKFSYHNADIAVGGDDIHGDSNDCTLTMDIEAHETTGFQEVSESFVQGIYSWSLSISGYVDMAATGMEALFDAMKDGGAQSLVFSPQGSTAGARYTGNVLLTSHAVGGGLKGACAYSASFQGTGDLTRTSN